MLVGGLGNTSFFGVPMVEAFYGKEGIATAIIVDQLGSFFVLSVLGITVAGVYSSGRPTVAEIIRRIAVFPPFIALVIALLLIPVEYAEWFSAIVEASGRHARSAWRCFRLACSCAWDILPSTSATLRLDLAFKLLLAPLAIYLLYVQLLGAHGQAIQVTLFEAAMPPMITAAIVASEHELDPPLANLMVAVGLILSFLHAHRVVVFVGERYERMERTLRGRALPFRHRAECFLVSQQGMLKPGMKLSRRGRWRRPQRRVAGTTRAGGAVGGSSSVALEKAEKLAQQRSVT